MNYKMYLYDLARDLGCGLRLAPDLDGMMYVEFGYVEGPDPDTSTRYTPQQAFAVGLHELGHFHHGHTQGRPPMGHLKHYFDNGVLQSEAEAWDFALAELKACEKILPDTRTFMNERCIGSYYAGAQRAGRRPGQTLGNGNRHHVSFTYDIPTPFFFEVRKRLAGEVSV